MVSVELHHGLKGEIADHVTVEDEKRVCSLREQVTGQCQGPSWGRGTGHHHLGGLSPWIQAQQSPSRLSLAPSLALNPPQGTFLSLLTCP